MSGTIAGVDKPVEPSDSGHLDVGDGHTVYWEVIGPPDGLPAVWVHGGPGAPPNLGVRGIFDPDRYRAVIFDQRGCGRSRPLASDVDADLSTNTTDHLVADMERLRIHLGIDRWVVIGGSWGVTLGLVYAQRHPDRVLAMVLGAITSGRLQETQWITRDMGRVFPREWNRFVELVPEAERHGDLAAAYARLLANPERAVREKAARRWCVWEDTHMSLAPDAKPHLSSADPSWQMVFARLVTHYWAHGCFLADNQVLAGMDRVAHIPATLIHGLHDISGPLDTAWKMHKAWPASRLIVVDDAGHSDGSLNHRFTQAINAMPDQIGPPTAKPPPGPEQTRTGTRVSRSRH